MSDSVSLSRRRALQLLTGAPMLPIAASLAALPLTAVAHGEGRHAGDHPRFGKGTRYEFGGMAAPTLAEPAHMATTYVASTLTRSIGKHSETFALGYEAFFLTGQTVPATGGGTLLAGSYFDIHGNPIMDASGAGDATQFYSDCPDGMSLLQVKQGRSHRRGCNRLFAVVQFEYTSANAAGESMYGKLPSPIAILTLDQDQKTGQLSLVSYYNVDTAPARGLWITCGASASPWGTHLSSEEYEPDATVASNSQLKAFSLNLFGDENTANPYDYGHLPEVTVKADGTGHIVKHYCLGRISHELVQVMPDERTVLMGDDATNGGLFMFVADRKRDLSAGTLYVAKWTQTSSVGPGAGDINWIKLGHATSDEIKALVDSGITAADIMDVQTTDPADTEYTRIRFNGKNNWVRLVPGMEKAAAFLETHRYAALVGGSMGFSKMEGTTVNTADKRAYSAMSYVYKSMTDGTTDIQVEGPAAGAVYAHVLEGNQFDLGGERIHSEWVSTHMSVPDGLAGEDLASPDDIGNTALADKIANPDNIKYSEAMRTLFIGEDSGMHVNNFLWAYDIDTCKLARLLSCPAGAESTGLQAVDDINGFSYIMSNFQHAGDWTGSPSDETKALLEPLIDANYNNKTSAAVGYLTLAGRI